MQSMAAGPVDDSVVGSDGLCLDESGGHNKRCSNHGDLAQDGVDIE